MNTLSQEIVDLICDHLESNPKGQRITKLAPYASISRQWKAAVEKKTFALLEISLLQVVHFVAYVNSDKARYVREVHFHAARFVPPKPLREGEIDYPEYEDGGSDKCMALTQMRLLTDLATVMKHISEWEIKDPILFSISGADIRFDGKSPLEFPIVKNIGTFSSIVKNVKPLSICRLATRMPELRKFRFAIPHHTKRQHSKLADEIATWGKKLPHLESLEILGEYDTLLRQHPLLQLDDMRNEAGVDRLCQELRLLSQKKGFKHLRTEYFPISRELFEDTQNPEAKMNWPTLEEFMVLSHDMSSTGEWYFKSEPHKEFRLKPDEAAVAPILQLFKRAITSESSPALKRAGLGMAYRCLWYDKGTIMLASLRGKEDERTLFYFPIY